MGWRENVLILRRDGHIKVLFVCIGNACRSPMAEAIACLDAPDAIDAFSAGLMPIGFVAELTKQTLMKNGYWVEGLESKRISPEVWEQVDLVINMSGRPKEEAFQDYSKVIDWDIEDPFERSPEDYQRAFEEIRARVGELAQEFRRKYAASRVAERRSRPRLGSSSPMTSRRTWGEFAGVAVMTAVFTLLVHGLATHREVQNAATTDVRWKIAAPNDAAKVTTPSAAPTTSSISDVAAETAKAPSAIVDAPPLEKAEGIQHDASEANPAQRGKHDVSEARSPNAAARPTEKPSRSGLVKTAIHGVDRSQPPKQAGRFDTGVDSRPLRNAKSEASPSRPPVPPPLEVKAPEPASLAATRSADVRPAEPDVKATAAPPVKQQVSPAAMTGFVTVFADPYPSLRVEGRSSNKQPQGASLQLGHLLSRVEPVYPEEAKRQGIQGTVKLHAVVDRYGSVKSLQAVSGPPLLGAAVMNAVRQWQFTETKLAGQLVETEVDVAVVFRLSNPPAPKS